MSNKWSYLSRTTACLSSHFQKLEYILRFKLISGLTGNAAPDDIDRQLFALPAREGDLGIVNPASSCDLEYSTSRAISEPLIKVILQGTECSYSCLADQLTAKLEVRQQKCLHVKQAAKSLKDSLFPTRRAMELAREKGASNWLTTLPIEEYGFSLHKTSKVLWLLEFSRSLLFPHTVQLLLCFLEVPAVPYQKCKMFLSTMCSQCKIPCEM